MKTPYETTLFRKDVKKCKKRGYDTKKLRTAIVLILKEEKLPKRMVPHKLKGDYADCWDIHIEPDWILIYKSDSESVELVRTGTHSDLFK